MCGIFGLSIGGQPRFAPGLLLSTIDDLFRLSESRGKEAAGLAIYGQDTIEVYKDAISATALIHSDAYRDLLARTFKSSNLSSQDAMARSISIIGHSRLVTNGSLEVHDNNQPVMADGLVGIHNGIIVNDEKLWRTFPTMQRHYQVDTEVILSLLRKFYTEIGCLTKAIRSTFQLLEGTASIAVLFNDLNVLALATNNGSLYTCSNHNGNIHLFASERYILQTLTGRGHVRNLIGDAGIQQIKPGSGCIIDIPNAKAEMFAFEREAELRHVTVSNGCSRAIVDVTPTKRSSAAARVAVPTIIPDPMRRRFAIDTRPIMSLRRCTRCILPETMPFIDFDDQGVCNYCRNRRPIEVLGQAALLEIADRYRHKDGRADCIVTFSGGRDSSFGVHYVKTVLKMNPITYTYDWGMVTDLARRNQARLCGKLGIEHILVSADIKQKRGYIRKNVTAWLKRPDLGTVPLFMAGDKQYYYYANKLMQQTGVELVIFGVNPFERTNFKTGFCGVRQPLNAASIYALSVLNQAKLAAYYGKQYLLNPAYLNSSILDTLGAFYSFYTIPHNYLDLYRYIMWDEQAINSTLIQEYDWEVATDTHTTWRIGDGTAAFYNYIYYCVAGFTENDTFRSNQIREGVISREQALATIYDENQARFESIQWYCNTIGVDMENALARINAIPKLYEFR